jgi:hypothetical protein
VGVAIVAWTTSPYVSLHFVTHWPNEMFQKGADDCAIGTDAMKFISRDIGGSKSASVELCFKARSADSGAQVVPFAIESTGRWRGNDRYSDAVQAYIDRRAEAFVLTPVDQQAAREEWRRQWWKNIRNGVLFAIGGWIALSLLQVMLGWIVRGFLGIPWGLDRRPEAPVRSAEVSS